MTETWSRRNQYRGQHRQGLRHGFGVCRYHTGDACAGEWSSGQSNSEIHTYKDGSRYVGEFEGGIKHGLGHYHFSRNGDTDMLENILLIGSTDLESIVLTRMAIVIKMLGMKAEDGGLECTTLKMGKLNPEIGKHGILDVTSSHSFVHPVSSIAVYHTKVLNAVQEARRAAEKAYEVVKVDKRVNRAVAVPNRAANAAGVAAVNAVQKQMHNWRNIAEC